MRTANVPGSARSLPPRVDDSQEVSCQHDLLPCLARSARIVPYKPATGRSAAPHSGSADCQAESAPRWAALCAAINENCSYSSQQLFSVVRYA